MEKKNLPWKWTLLKLDKLYSDEENLLKFLEDQFHYLQLNCQAGKTDFKMSIKDGKFIVFQEEVPGRRIKTEEVIKEVMEAEFFLYENKNLTAKSDVSIQERLLEGSVIKRVVPLNESGKNLLDFPYNCAICQNICNSCKYICVTCKSPCKKCFSQSCKTLSTDTDDFDQYLESLTKKVKPQAKVKAIGTDTCDLEGHFDYYKFEKKIIRIQKHVATDCADLILRKSVVKKPVKNSIAVDTSDLSFNVVKNDLDDGSEYEFFWNKKEEIKTYTKKVKCENKEERSEEKCDDDASINSLIIDEDVSCLKEEDNKENFKVHVNSKDVNFDDSSTDESDIDLITSCKVSKCRLLAKKHKLTLKQINLEKNTLYKCNICGASFLKKHLGVLHLGNHLENNFFKCLTCSDSFTSLDLLYSHVKSAHNNSSGTEVENKENSRCDLPLQKVNKIYHCILCPEGEKNEFDSFKALNLHKKEKHGVETFKTNENEKTEKRQRIRREFICLICGKQFKSSKALKDHSPVHTGEKNYHCDICKKSYTTSANLKIHKKTHTGTRNFVCSVCNKAFHKKDSLKVHFRKHSGERPFQCDLCPMKFDRNYILKNHRYTHFSEKTFICPVCGKTFTTHGGLNNHEKGHKKDPFAKKPRKPAVKPTLDAENAVICDVCGKIYSTRSNLRIHKFVHLGVKPFECTVCHQTYAKKDSMLTHMRKHTDERPFACETCGMTFYRNHTLKTHLLRHTGERPHKCKMCGKSFTQSSSLAYHVRNHDKKVEKKKVTEDSSSKTKRKRIVQGSKLGTKKLQKNIKSSVNFHSDNVSDKKSVNGAPDLAILKEPVPLNFQDRDISRGSHFMNPVPEKEILILDKHLGVELPRSPKEGDFYAVDKDISYTSPYNIGKFNYYVTKGHLAVKPKNIKVEISVEKNEDDMENLIISKNVCITKEGNLVSLHRDQPSKETKEVVLVGDHGLNLKPQTALPVAGEILNAAFISDENGEMIPLSSMTLQGLGAENVMISPVIPIEGDDRKGMRSSKVFVDPKIAYNLAAGPRNQKENYQKEKSHKIKHDLEPGALQIQTTIVDDHSLQGMQTFYDNVQQNGL